MFGESILWLGTPHFSGYFANLLLFKLNQNWHFWSLQKDSNKQENPFWDLDSTSIRRNQNQFPCCLCHAKQPHLFLEDAQPIPIQMSHLTRFFGVWGDVCLASLFLVTVQVSGMHNMQLMVAWSLLWIDCWLLLVKWHDIKSGKWPRNQFFSKLLRGENPSFLDFLLVQMTFRHSLCVFQCIDKKTKNPVFLLGAPVCIQKSLRHVCAKAARFGRRRAQIFAIPLGDFLWS